MNESIKILYVEDEEFLAKIVKETLESRGYQVMWVEDGASGSKMIENFIPDLCILDVMLPNLDGFSLGKIIRSKYPLMPIIFLTAKNQTEDVLKGFKSGGNDYIKKPFSLEELMARMENLLTMAKQSSPIRDDTVTIGRYTFNEKRGELTLDDQVFKLTHREAQVLKYLFTRRHELINRRKLLRDLWGDDNQFNSRNLDVYVTKLRQYLREDHTIQILTLKGEGYRFVC